MLNLNLKELLRPNKKKILNGISLFLMLFAIPIIAVYLHNDPLGGLIYQYYTPLFMIFGGPILSLFSLGVILFIAYASGCYIDMSKKRMKGIAIYMISIIIIPLIIAAVIAGYNHTVASYCNSDSDCTVSCIGGSGEIHNKYYIESGINYMASLKCSSPGEPTCENHRCRAKLY